VCHEAPPQQGDAFAVEAALRRAAEFAEACEAGVARPGPGAHSDVHRHS
jgi:hypothetical protein